MTDLIRLAAALLLFLFAGHLVLSFIEGKGKCAQGRAFRLAAAYPLGVGIVTFQMFLTSLASLPYSIFGIVLPWAVAALLLWGFRKNFPAFLPAARPSTAPADRRPARWTRLEIAALAIVGFQCLYVLVRALTFPLIGYDAFAHWWFKANTFFIDQQISPSNMINGYPLLVSLAPTWIYLCLGEINDQLAKILYPGFFMSLSVLFYHTAKRLTSRTLAALFTAMLATVPQVVRHGGGLSLNWSADYVGYADLPLAVYLMAGAAFFCLFVKTQERPSLLLSMLFFGFGAWTKNEGLPLAAFGLLLAAAYLFYTRPMRQAITATLSGLGLLLCLVLPWMAYKSFTGTEGWVSQMEPTAQAQYWDRLPVIFKAIAEKAFSPPFFNLAWVFLFIGGLLNWRSLRTPSLSLYLYAMMALQWSGYVLVYALTPFDLRWHLGTSVDRLLLHLLPLALLVTALNTHDLLAASKRAWS